MFGRIFLVVIAVAVAAITKDFLTAGRILSAGAKVAVAAVSGATGSIVSQGIGVATGIQDKFSWNAVALSALSAGVGASGVGDKFANAVGVTSKLGVVAVSGAFNSALTQGIGVATGLQDKFSWSAVAAAGAGAYVGAKIGGLLPTNTPRFAANLVASTASALANASVRTLIDGSDFGDNLIAALPDVLGQTIGGAFADGISGASKPKPLTASKIELFTPIEKQSYAPITDLADIPNLPMFEIAREVESRLSAAPQVATMANFVLENEAYSIDTVQFDDSGDVGFQNLLLDDNLSLIPIQSGPELSSDLARFNSMREVLDRLQSIGEVYGPFIDAQTRLYGRTPEIGGVIGTLNGQLVASRVYTGAETGYPSAGINLPYVAGRVAALYPGFVPLYDWHFHAGAGIPLGMFSSNLRGTLYGFSSGDLDTTAHSTLRGSYVVMPDRIIYMTATQANQAYQNGPWPYPGTVVRQWNR